MSTAALPTSRHLERSLSSTLTLRERGRLGLQLSTVMLSSGLLVLGLVLRQYGPVEQRNVAELVLAVAALIVLLPPALVGLAGLLKPDGPAQSAQLVALASLAAFVTGQFIIAALIPIVLSLGHFLEERSVLGARAAIDGLRQLQAQSATVLRDNQELVVPIESLLTGDIVVCRPGETIPADGDVVMGRSTVDQSSITGESTPADVAEGLPVYSGSINLTGVLQIRVTQVGQDTALGKVLGLLRDAEQAKTPVLKLIEQYAAYYVPAILLIAAVTLFVSRDLSRAIAVLVVGCPMALILASPTAMVAALAVASRRGILIKNGKFLESLADVDTVIFDKTGTVTLGQLNVIDVRPTEHVMKEALLEAAAACAVHSRHPVSRAIVRFAGDNVSTASAAAPADVMETAGQGLIVREPHRTILMGKREWLESQQFLLPDDLPHDGPLVWIAQRPLTDEAGESIAMGCIALADETRFESRTVVDVLRSLGISRSVLLTGDRRAVAERIGQSLGIDAIVAEVLPDQKLVTVEAEKSAGRSPLMVGDGINDALALAAADVGIALGANGTDVALRSADLVLMTDDLTRIPDSIRLARQTRRTIHLSILVGTGISVLMLGLATSGVISPLGGAILHNVGEIFVIMNSAQLLRFK